MQRASVRWQVAGFAAAFVLPAIALPSRAAAANDVVDTDPLVRARVALDDLRIDEAMRIARPLTNDPRPKVRARALEVLALAHLVSGRNAEGKVEIAELYELAPAFVQTDPSLPPHVTRLFDEEAARPHARAAPLSLRANGASVDPAAFQLLTHAEVAHLELSCKPTSGGPFQPVPTKPEGAAYTFRLPTVAPHLCYATAVDIDELPLGRLGTMTQPVLVQPQLRDAPPAPPPASSAGSTIFTKWWFWTAVGVVVVGTTAAVFVATSNSSPSQSPPRRFGPGGGWALAW
jgi:hypothetical protein